MKRLMMEMFEYYKKFSLPCILYIPIEIVLAYLKFTVHDLSFFLVSSYQVHEDFRLVVTVSVTKAAPPDLTLLARPLYSQPAPTIPATLAAAATLINMHNYRHHCKS